MTEKTVKPKAYISKIVVEGFKSYGPKRREIPLGEGFIAIVGPNGSGKSNIGDSISFALGLASSKVLRAKNLSYLIWNKGNKRADYAYVEVHFKNEGAFPINSSEVVFSRKVFPNGRSVFKINGKTVKERDVKDLLTRAGITENAYNVVLQGDIIHFLKMTPLQRRKLIEDIAGIGEFDEKKEKALIELGEVEVKLSELKLVLEELENRLKLLEEDRRRLEIYNSLKGKEKELETKLVLKQIHQLKKKKGEMENLLKEVEKKITDLQEERENLKKLLEEKENQLEEVEKLLEPYRENLGRLETREEFLKNELKNLEGREKNLLLTLKGLKEKEEKLLEEMEELNRQKEAVEREIETLKEKIEEKERELEKFDIQINQLQERFGKALKRLSWIEEKLKELSKERKEKERGLNELLRELDRLDQKVEQTEENLRQLEEQKKEILALFIGNASAEKEKYQKIVEEKKKTVENLQLKLRQIEKKIEEARRRREEILKEIVRLEAQANFSDNEVVGYLKRNIPGVYGTVAELIKVREEEFLIPVEVAGGNRLRYVVVEDEDVAKECISLLKRENLGRLTFIPLSKIRVPKIDFLPRVRGVIDFVYKLVEYDPSVEKAILYVFGDTILVENYETAKRLGIGIYRMVTLSGELFEKGGTITGGTYKSSNLLQASYIKQRLEELKNELVNLEKRKEKLEKEYKKVKEQLWSEEGALNYALNKLKELEKDNDSAVERLKKIEKKIQQGEEYLNYLREELNKKEKLLSELQENLAKLEMEIEDFEKEKENLMEEVSQSGLDSLRDQRNVLLNQLEELKRIFGEKEKQLIKLNSTLENLQRELQNLKEEREKTLKELEGIKRRREEIVKEIEEIKLKLEKLGKEVVALMEKKETLKSERDQIKRELLVLEAKVEKQKGEREKLLTELAKLEQEISTLQEGLPKEKPLFEPIESFSYLKEELKKVKTELKRLGNINFRAEEEYLEIENRYKEIKEKYETLRRERKALTDFIDEVEKKRTKIFMDTFKTINRYFREIFAFLSPGGKAYMEIEKPYDPFAGGINMFVKPRGKEVKYLEAMSGGEKTLAALALIFALQRYRPAPFYYFDEVDAHLDEINATKVGELIKQYSKEAQFIVVTLRESVAYLADKIIGVTSKGGVSQTYFVEPSVFETSKIS